MIKKFASTALFSVILTTLALAQRIAYVDVTAVLESLPEYQQAQEQLDRVATQWRQEIAQSQDQIKGMYSKYQAEQVMLSEEMKKSREEEIMNKEKEVRELQRQKFGPEGACLKNAKNSSNRSRIKCTPLFKNLPKTKVLNTSSTKAALPGCCMLTRSTTKQKMLKPC